MTKIKVGFGYDIHRLVKGRKLFLGGVRIPFAKGLLGHSDADVLIHAVCDAMLGALAKGDIGEHFPDTDPKYKGISSVTLLKEVYGIIKREGFKVGNLDATILADKPRLGPLKDDIRRSLAKYLKLAVNNVSVKAGSNEGLDAVGKGNAISAYAIVLLKEN